MLTRMFKTAAVIAAVLFAVPAMAQVNPGTSPLTGPKGGTNNAFMQFTGPATSLKSYALPNASDTIDTLNAIQTFTAAKTFAAVVTISSASANALAVGANGATNPAFNVDASTASSATGINIKSAAAGGSVAVSATSSGTNENILIDAKGSGTVSIASVSTGNVNVSRTLSTINHMVTSASANALAVGVNGTSNPALNVDASTASSATGINIKSAAAAGGVALAAISSGTNEGMTINAKGSGGITVANTSTGAVNLGNGGGGVTVASALTYGGVALSNSVTGTGAMVLATSPTLTAPNLGTPSAATLTNATGLPVAGISGLGTGVGAALGTNLNATNGLCTYQQGTWTPNFTGSSTAGTGQTYSFRVGFYTICGTAVTAHFSMQASSLGTAAGNIQISGLPVTSSATANDFGTCSVAVYTATGSLTPNVGMTGLITAGTTLANIFSQGVTGVAAVTVTQAGSTVEMIGVCEYHT